MNAFSNIGVRLRISFSIGNGMGWDDFFPLKIRICLLFYDALLLLDDGFDMVLHP